MKILVTGAKGFIGKNLVSQLRNIGEGKANNYKISGEELTIFEYDVDSDIQELCRPQSHQSQRHHEPRHCHRQPL